jgi:hypothetical protein
MRLRPGTVFFGLILGVLTFPERLSAQPDPCAPSATVSPCFDSDALFVPTGATHFSTLPSARPLAVGGSTLLLATDFALRPVVLSAPSPDPEGREIHVVNATSTVTVGVGFGLGHGLGVNAEFGFVPYQDGTGVEGVTAQTAPPLESAAVRDPRIGASFTFLGRNEHDPVALAARLGVAPPLGDETLLAGASGTTVLPGLVVEVEADRFAFGSELGLRLRRAVDFGTVRKGSEGVLGVGAGYGVLTSPRLFVGLEAWLRPGLAGHPEGTPPEALDLPAEWLLSTTFAWDPNGGFSLAAAGGSGLPLSKGTSPSGSIESFAGVTAPAFRALLALRFTPPQDPEGSPRD